MKYVSNIHTSAHAQVLLYMNAHIHRAFSSHFDLSSVFWCVFPRILVDIVKLDPLVNTVIENALVWGVRPEESVEYV